MKLRLASNLCFSCLSLPAAAKEVYGCPRVTWLPGLPRLA